MLDDDSGEGLDDSDGEFDDSGEGLEEPFDDEPDAPLDAEPDDDSDASPAGAPEEDSDAGVPAPFDALLDPPQPATASAPTRSVAVSSMPEALQRRRLFDGCRSISCGGRNRCIGIGGSSPRTRACAAHGAGRCLGSSHKDAGQRESFPTQRRS